MTTLDRNQAMGSAAMRASCSNSGGGTGSRGNGSEPTERASQLSPDAWLNETASLAAAGDRYAVDRLARHIQPMIQRYCRARIGRAAGGYQTADDVAQEACLGIFSALPRYLGKSYPFNALAFRIAANKVADHYRRQRADVSTPLEDVPETGSEHAGPEEALLRQELSQYIGLLLEGLPETQREILVLRIGVGLSATATAQAVGSTPGAVRIAQHRALNTLRAAVSPTPAPPATVRRGRWSDGITGTP